MQTTFQMMWHLLQSRTRYHWHGRLFFQFQTYLAQSDHSPLRKFIVIKSTKCSASLLNSKFSYVSKFNYKGSCSPVILCRSCRGSPHFWSHCKSCLQSASLISVAENGGTIADRLTPVPLKTIAFQIYSTLLLLPRLSVQVFHHKVFDLII